jgi:UDP:flavonoid glycosyltransferase YjiC (YdhE family)
MHPRAQWLTGVFITPTLSNEQGMKIYLREAPLMARFLFASQPITGHVVPALPIVSTLVERGNEVMWYVGKKFRRQVEAAGARFAPYRDAYDYDDGDYDAAFPGRDRLAGLSKIKFDFINLFMKQIGPQHHDILALLNEFPADAIVGDPSLFAPFSVNEKGGPPNAVYNVSCLGIKGRDVSPFGLGILPRSSSLGRLRNRMLYFLSSNVIFKAVSDEFSRQCVRIGVRPRKFDGVLVSPFLFLQPTVPSFEYPRSDLPPQVHFIGPLLPDARDITTTPAWWDEVVNKRRSVVLVTQGTVATDARELVAPTLRALADMDVLVVAAGVKDEGALGLDRVPANARIEPFVAFKPLMPHVDLYVTNGGFGGVQFALAHGVPVVAGGNTEDKPEVNNRVAYSGVGINLKTNTPTSEQVRGAVMTVLSDLRYREKARQIQAEMASHDAPREAALLLEQLALTKRPVLLTE